MVFADTLKRKDKLHTGVKLSAWCGKKDAASRNQTQHWLSHTMISCIQGWNVVQFLSYKMLTFFSVLLPEVRDYWISKVSISVKAQKLKNGTL